MKSTSDQFLETANVARLLGEDALADALMRAAVRHAGGEHDALPPRTRGDAVEPCEVDEPAVGDVVRVDSDRSPKSASVFPEGRS